MNQTQSGNKDGENLERDRQLEEYLSILGEIDDLADWLQCHALLHHPKVTNLLISFDFDLFGIFVNLLGSDIATRFGRLLDKDPASISLFAMGDQISEESKKSNYLLEIKSAKLRVNNLLTLRNKAVAHSDRAFREGEVEYTPMPVEDLQRELESLQMTLLEALGEDRVPPVHRILSRQWRLTSSVDKLIGILAASRR
jgi:hypothetical protein